MSPKPGQRLWVVSLGKKPSEFGRDFSAWQARSLASHRHPCRHASQQLGTCVYCSIGPEPR